MPQFVPLRPRVVEELVPKMAVDTLAHGDAGPGHADDNRDIVPGHEPLGDPQMPEIVDGDLLPHTAQSHRLRHHLDPLEPPRQGADTPRTPCAVRKDRVPKPFPAPCRAKTAIASSFGVACRFCVLDRSDPSKTCRVWVSTSATRQEAKSSVLARVAW